MGIPLSLLYADAAQTVNRSSLETNDKWKELYQEAVVTSDKVILYSQNKVLQSELAASRSQNLALKELVQEAKPLSPFNTMKLETQMDTIIAKLDMILIELQEKRLSDLKKKYPTTETKWLKQRNENN